MDEDHLVAAARTVALNPVRARLVARAQDWRWSSVTAHLDGRDDALVTAAPLIERIGGRFADWIETPAAPAALSALRAAEPPDRGPGVGRPLGSRAFLDRLALALAATPRPKRRGPKPKSMEIK
jgi:putative transposase